MALLLKTPDGLFIRYDASENDITIGFQGSSTSSTMTMSKYSLGGIAFISLLDKIKELEDKIEQNRLEKMEDR